MSTLDQLFGQVATETQAGAVEPACQGIAANSPASAADELYVLIPSIDGGAQQFGPCPWAPSNALPVEGDRLLVIFDEQETPWAVVLAPVPGGGAGSGDLSYVHDQSALAAVWTVVHGLGKYPSVSVVDTGGNELLPSIAYLDTNSLTVSFAAATSGKVYVN